MRIEQLTLRNPELLLPQGSGVNLLAMAKLILEARANGVTSLDQYYQDQNIEAFGTLQNLEVDKTIPSQETNTFLDNLKPAQAEVMQVLRREPPLPIEIEPAA